MPKKLTYEFVKEQIEKEKGYKLLSKEYIGALKKLEISCDKGHKYEVVYGNFQRGQRCLKCSNDKKRLSYEFVKEQIEKEKGYKLLSKEYIGALKKLEISCDKGHKYEVVYGNFQRGQRCLKCSNDKKRLSYEFVKEQIEKEKGYKLLSKEYVNNRTKLEILCNKEHIYEVRYNDFQNGKRCPYCVNDKQGRYNIKLTYGFVKEQIESVDGYKLLSKKYVNNNTKLEIRCPKGHIYEVTYGNFQQGGRCPICNTEKTSSKGEKEVLQMVEKFTGEDILTNDRTQIINPLTGCNLELDIWIPSLNKAIEYNGTYWHSSNKQKEKDKEKVKQCKEKGIDLLIIKEEHWQGARILCERIIEEFIKS